MLKTESLTKSFGSKKVLKGISLDIANGKITAIVGKNGAGKSTLISLIAGYKKADAGTIDKSTLSVMPDADNLFRDMRGKYFLRYSAQIKKATLTDEGLEKLATQLFLKDDLDKKIKSYSFGMKKKISFIQAYIGDFDTYIFDEPTSGIDVETEKIMMELIVGLKEKGKAVLLTSHNIEEVERYSDYVYILSDGVVTKNGTVNDLTEQTGELPNYVVESDSRQLTLLEEILKEKQVADYQIRKNILYINHLSQEKIQVIIREAFDKDIAINGFWQEKRALREIVFEEDAKAEK